MKVLIDHHTPFRLAHGGLQTQIEQTLHALGAIGVDAERLRWWDESQTGDLIHFFGRPDASYIHFAHGKGMRVVMQELLAGLGARSALTRFAQKLFMTTAKAVLPSPFTARLAWDSYRLADACIALTPWEGYLMGKMFDAPPERVHVVPNGVEPVFPASAPRERDRWLVCTATITPLKRVVELAEAAALAKVPVRIIGKPYAESDPYAQSFFKTAHRHGEFVRYEGPITDRTQLASIYRAARGFVLLSTMETLSLSALEAAACECPLLLSDLPWARSVFKRDATYCPVADATRIATVLRQFYDAAPSLKPPPKPCAWTDVALQLKRIYESLLSQRT